MLHDNMKDLMHESGRVEIDNFEELISNFFNNTKSFMIIPITYMFYDKNYRIYNNKTKQLEPHPKIRKIFDIYPAIIDNDIKDKFKNYKLDIPGVTKYKHLNYYVDSYLPQGIRLLRHSELEIILTTNGYSNGYFEYSDEDEEKIRYYLYAAPIIKGQYMYANLREDDMAYLFNGSISPSVIDGSSYPRSIPDEFVTNELNLLVIQDKLKPRFVKYALQLDEDTIYITDYFEEYKLHDNRYVLYKVDTGVNAGKYYWLEVEPVYDVDKTLRKEK